MYKIKRFILIFFIGLITGVKAADIKSIGVPYVRNYAKSSYQSGNQNWSIAKDSRGVMYFGNSEGLLTFDGKYWQRYKMPHGLIVRAVAADKKDNIYTGGFGEIGYWSYNRVGRFVYKSLTHLIPKKYDLKDEVWKIYTDKGKVIFQSFSSIFIYENGRIHVVKAPNPFLFLFNVNSRFFVEVLGKGLYELKGTQLQLVENSNILGNTGILSILPYKKDSFLIGTAKKGLFVFDGKKIKPFITTANDFLKTYQLNNGSVVLDKYFAYGTILNGIIILDEAGRVVQKINKSTGLQNNTVLSLYADKEQNLWAGLDNGIDRVELNSPLYFYFDKTGKFGTVYSSIIFNNNIYLGTNQGLFYSKRADNAGSFSPFDFNFINNSQGQVWDISLIDGQLICGHNEATYAVMGNELKKLSDVKGGWVIKKLHIDPKLFIQGHYTGLAIYKKNAAGKLIFSHRIKNFGEPSRYVEQDDKGHIWVSHAYKGLYKLILADDYGSVKSSRYYDKKQGLPGSYNINVFNLENRLVFSSDSGFYTYDNINDKFFNYTELNKKLGSFAYSNKIINAGDRKYWFINKERVALVNLLETGKVQVDSTRFSLLNRRMVQYYENISRISDAIYLISVDDGFVIFNADDSSNALKNRPPNVLIRKIENTQDRIYILSENNIAPEIEIPYEQNSLRITYSLPYYREAEIKFQYFLEGYSNKWSEWTAQTQKEFTNLNPGKYRFKVRAKVDEKTISATTVFEFDVLPPWYATVWAILTYITILLVLALLGRRLYRKKLKKHQENIQRQLEIEQEEYLRREVLVNEQKIVKLKNEQLQAELESKSRELANSAMNIVYKNELLQKIQQELLLLKDSNGKQLADDQLKKIQKVIDEGMSDDRDWDIFEKSFNEAHENFFKKLKSTHPDLVPNDLKLCAYLRMNMSSKEIASLLNISLRGVEIRRYRLRKKLNVPHDKNLVEFLIEL